jgi:hypothetical protein
MNRKRGRPTIGWEEMKQNGAKPHRWQKRKAQEEAAAAAKLVDHSPKIIAKFHAQCQKASDTFSARLVPGETIMRSYDGKVFNWPEEHMLTDARACAQNVVDADCKFEDAIYAQCVDFLVNLEDGAKRGLYMDPEQCDNALLILVAYAPDYDPLYNLEVLDLCEWFGWRDKDGKRVVTETYFLGDKLLPIIRAAGLI